MTRADLFREYARVIEMCEGTCVNPNACVKGGGSPSSFKTAGVPWFEPTLDYTFAVCIIENKPAFAGDIVCDKNDGERFKVLRRCSIHGAVFVGRFDDGGIVELNQLITSLSWIPPSPARQVLYLGHDREDMHEVHLQIGEHATLLGNNFSFRITRED